MTALSAGHRLVPRDGLSSVAAGRGADGVGLDPDLLTGDHGGEMGFSVRAGLGPYKQQAVDRMREKLEKEKVW